MKNVILSAVAMVFVLVSCNQKNKQGETSATETAETTSQLYACSMHPEVTGKKGDECSKCGMELSEPVVSKKENHEHEAEVINRTNAFSLTEIQNEFSNVKNALEKDDTKAAATAGKSLYVIFNEIDINSIDAKTKKDYLDITESAKENAEHIGDNEGKLDHQKDDVNESSGFDRAGRSAQNPRP